MRSLVLSRIVFAGIVLLTGCSDPTPFPSFEEQLAKDKEIINSYLTSKGITARPDPGNFGVMYASSAPGTGISPQYAADSILMNYTLKLIPSEKEIEKSPSPQKFSMVNLITGMQIGLLMMKEGEKGTIFIPSGLGYGAVDKGAIPANSVLLFEVDLQRVIPQLRKDTIAINAYLASKNLVNSVSKDPSGLRYLVSVEGTGTRPTSSSTVTVKYTGKLMSNETVFDQSASANLALSQVIKGFQIGLTKFPVGSKVTLYIPSVLGYGFYANGPIPSNSNLIFDVEVLSSKD
ncbi:MAG: FKBP-type peptidyl-prolyl cis-trans isomerase [Bacteroidota bacterium]|jgi:FKBP-type peptidyl-prolyl cis-trans isomerase FkpA|nr:FKBP-type peptidyl-prolyl cis-trans isomerase [Flammeovirgaceae bacterium]MCZ8071044.1 FKBP-type peptidyl-prolyl cis-trans isomerase [Cytophagales bacterium]